MYGIILSMTLNRRRATKARRPNGYVLFQDKEIVIIATGFREKSRNSKTGNMIQIWILRSDMTPVDAVHSGADVAICGNCKWRGLQGKKRVCYVNIAQGPQAVYRAFWRGVYPVLTDYSIFSDRAVRFGAYGDPVYIPFNIVAAIAQHARKYTGYTHQWSKPEFQSFQSFLMASVDTAAEFEQARAMGWRTFRVRTESAPLMSREVMCPASEEAGHRTTCENCGLCNGAKMNDQRATISIMVHGIGSRNLIQITGGK